MYLAVSYKIVIILKYSFIYIEIMSKTVYGYIRTGNYLGVTNIGDGVPLMKGVSNNDYDIKSIDGSNGVTVTDNSDKVTIGIDSASSGFLSQ